MFLVMVHQAKSTVSCIYIPTLLGVSNGRGNLGYISACARSFLFWVPAIPLKLNARISVTKHQASTLANDRSFHFPANCQMSFPKLIGQCQSTRVRNRPLNDIEFCWIVRSISRISASREISNVSTNLSWTTKKNKFRKHDVAKSRIMVEYIGNIPEQVRSDLLAR